METTAAAGPVSTSSASTFDLPGAALARSRRRRRRFLAAATVALGVLGVSLGVSYLGPSGSVAVGVSAGGSSNLVYAVTASSLSLPSGVDTLEYTTAADVTAGTGVLPNWSAQIAAGSSGTVPSGGGGDLGLFDASQAPNALIVNVYITNLAALQQDYSSFTFPVNVYYSDCSGSSPKCAWTQASLSGSTLPTYITNTQGFLSFRLPSPGASGHKYYDLTMDPGGSFYTTATTQSSSASLQPDFYFTAQST